MGRALGEVSGVNLLHNCVCIEGQKTEVASRADLRRFSAVSGAKTGFSGADFGGFWPRFWPFLNRFSAVFSGNMARIREFTREFAA
jgi:hypothetical protein